MTKPSIEFAESGTRYQRTSTMILDASLSTTWSYRGDTQIASSIRSPQHRGQDEKPRDKEMSPPVAMRQIWSTASWCEAPRPGSGDPATLRAPRRF